MGYRASIARYVAKRGIAQMCLCETKYQRGVSHRFGGVLISLKVSRDMGYRSDSIAISRDMGPLSENQLQAQNQEIIDTKKRLFSLSAKRLKSDQKEIF